MTKPLADQLNALFDAERAVRRAHAELLHAERAELAKTARAEVDRALALLAKDPEDATVRLVRLAALLGDIGGDGAGPRTAASTPEDAVDALVDILACEEPEARHVASQALEDLAFDRFKEVALGIERALVRLPKGNAALSELPYLLAEVPEPGALKLLGRFLQHADADAVAAAIEALVEVGDPSAAPMLAPLEKDARQVQLDDEEGERVSIGDLATEARQLLAEIEAPHAGHVGHGQAKGGGR